MNMSYHTTDNFTSSPYIFGNLAKTIDLTKYREVCARSLKDIRKETENSMKKKKVAKKQSTVKSKKNTGNNIVENAIGSNLEVLEALDNLKSKKNKSSDDKIVQQNEVIKTSTSPNKNENDGIAIKDTLSKSGITDDVVVENKKSEQFIETAVFDKEDIVNVKAESGGIDIVEFLHKAESLKQVQAFADILVEYNFIISHSENNGSALFSEIITCLDRITLNKKNLLEFVCDNVQVYKKSLIDITDLCIAHCNEDPVDVKIAETLRMLKTCMR